MGPRICIFLINTPYDSHPGIAQASLSVLEVGESPLLCHHHQKHLQHSLLEGLLVPWGVLAARQGLTQWVYGEAGPCVLSDALMMCTQLGVAPLGAQHRMAYTAESLKATDELGSGCWGAFVSMVRDGTLDLPPPWYLPGCETTSGNIKERFHKKRKCAGHSSGREAPRI